MQKNLFLLFSAAKVCRRKTLSWFNFRFVAGKLYLPCSLRAACLPVNSRALLVVKSTNLLFIERRSVFVRKEKGVFGSKCFLIISAVFCNFSFLKVLCSCFRKSAFSGPQKKSFCNLDWTSSNLPNSQAFSKKMS